MEALVASLRPDAPTWRVRDPLDLDDATRELYRRAIVNPSSLSDAERRKILRRPSREEEDASSRELCGSTMSELITKAIQNHESLTYQESKLVMGRPKESYPGEMLREKLRMSESDRDLLSKAMEAALTEDEVAAQTNAVAVQNLWRERSSAAWGALSDFDRALIKRAVHIPWQDHIINLEDPIRKAATCGFVVFYSNAVNWLTFNERMQAATKYGFDLCMSKIKDSVREGFTLHGLQYDDAESLQDRFAAMRDVDEIPKGLRRDAFLYVDDEAMQSQELSRPFLWLWEPQETAKPLKVNAKHIAPLLIARLTQRDLSTEKAQKWPFRSTSDLEQLHKVAGRSMNGAGERDGIWPPRAVSM
ncbi:unnamed protein product [Clonostachys chloroleuca]|uniref:Uncharacterized protein n=1 Tax=Clonostachys chloroleuca TaxID=1926264 RepID=A0AA35LP83_9HYPO|nr:unnamed protein product [Clonostachys chloroleuca]